VRVESEQSVVLALPERARKPLLVTAALGALTVVVLGVLFAHETVGTAADVTIRESLQKLYSPWRQIALIIDYTAEPVGAVIMFTTLVLVFRKLGHHRAALLVLAGPGLAIVITTGLKPLVGRDINNGFLAFPSGHTATATAVTLVAMLVVVERTKVNVAWVFVAATAAGLAMAWAQVLLNAHYPTDTLGGYATALAAVPAAAWVIDRFMAWRSGSTRTAGPTRSAAPAPPPPDADRTP
jgi:membrane-associated phospholipid phosphatase